MGSLLHEADASFFSLLHRLAASTETAKEQASTAESGPSPPRVAFSDGPDLPDDSQFHEVDCRSLTSNGFSFLASESPRRRTLFAALRLGPGVVYLAARVIRTVELSSDDEDASPPTLVECRFLRRITP